jgi:uncharacterized protein (DUF2147 family)
LIPARFPAERLRVRLWFYSAAVALLAFAPVAAATAASPEGEWVVNDGSGRIRISNCGGSLWGIVTWEASPGIDDQNPDPAKRNRPILGTSVLRDLKPGPRGEWWGSIYNSSNGRTYSGGVRLKSPDVLRVFGCVFRVLCGGQDWTRAEKNLPSQIPADTSACDAADGPR